MRIVSALLAATSLAAAAPVLAAPTTPTPVVRTNPEWAQKPTGDQLEPLYPSKARAEGVDGKAVIECVVALDGALSNCKVVSEEPAGYGFGEATLRSASLFRMKPPTVNGKPIGGTTVQIPLNWRLGDSVEPNMSRIDEVAAAHCFGVYFAATEKALPGDPRPNIFYMIQWAGTAFMKYSTQTSNPATPNQALQDEIEPARRRQAADPTAFKAELDSCDASMANLYRPAQLAPAAPGG